jgi:ABC-2 type transport system permease protein
MHSLVAGVRNELYKMLYKKKTVVFLGFSAIVPALLAFLFGQFQTILGMSSISGDFPLAILGMYTLFLIPLFIFLTAADLFAGELSSRTLKLSLLRPITRFKLFLAKTLSLGIGIVTLLLLTGIISALASAFLGGASDIANGFVWMKAYAAAFVPMMALGVAAILCAQFFKSSSSALIFCILLYAAAKILPVFFHSASVFSIAAYTDWHILWLGSAVSAGKLFTTFLFLLSSSVLLFSAGFYVFERKEI